MAGATLIAASEVTATPREPDSRPTYSCPECGHVLRVVGLGRHRVYFELGEERFAVGNTLHGDWGLSGNLDRVAGFFLFPTGREDLDIGH